MTTNFDFLKTVDNDLFGIISEAEKLYRDEYFEQCMTQTRRFGENLCKKVLRNTTDTFDEMLSTLKDKITTEEEKEFVDDLYFLKKYGNNATHSLSVKKDGITALECLKRAFEAAINYSVFNCKAKSEILSLNYDVELLVTGQKNKKSLSEKYSEQKVKSVKKTSVKSKKRQSHVLSPEPNQRKLPIFWILVGFFSIVAMIILIVLSF